MARPIQPPRSLSPAIRLSLACGAFLLPGRGAEERGRLEDAIVAAGAAGLTGTAAALLETAMRRLCGKADDAALSAALSDFNAPFCRRKAAGPEHRGLVEDELPLLPPSTHAARVADAMEDDR